MKNWNVQSFAARHDRHQLGVEPVIYRAGRYGIGPHTAILREHAGVGIDTSVRDSITVQRRRQFP
ncbi:MAG: hypothetical protein R3D83_10105 [Caenibius sp.]